MGRKKLFSLIEIAVAMAVAAIGVAAIMALLPVAVKSTSDSVGDTLATDVANSVIAQLDRASWEHFDWIQNLKTTKPTTVFSDSKARDYANMKMDSESYRIEPASGIQDGHFAFLFGPPNKPADFAAEVFCWRDTPGNLKFTTLNAKTGKVGTPTKLSDIKYPSDSGKTGQPYVRVFIEISWPLTKPYKKGSGTSAVYPRQSRLFVREYLDPTYYKEEK
ncbi:MAG: hypothetical protein IJT68_08050 [Lentisphaeria bacterium]|nr:hypothetical protein [Lentisphaeria bacterium]MBR3507093.1 hypothetical protein [Lentisphaeria bacterium]